MGHCSRFATSNRNTGLGQKLSQTGMNVLFMALAVVQFGTGWGTMTKPFHRKGLCFQRLKLGFIDMLEANLDEAFVTLRI